MNESTGTIEKIIQGTRSYLIGNKKEVLDSPLQIELSKEKYDKRKDMLNFYRGGLPITIETSAVIGMTVCYLFNPSPELLIADLITATDIFFRELNFEETNTLGYGLVGRIRDTYKTLSKKYSKKP